MKITQLAWSLFFIFLLHQPIVDAQTTAPARVLKYGVIEFPPYFYIDHETVHGSLVDRIENMVREAGFIPQPHPLPLKRVAQELAAGKMDIWVGVARHPLLKEGTFIGKTVIVKLNLSTWSLDRKIEITSFEDFKKYSVILVTPYSYGMLIDKIKNPKNGIRYFEAKDNDQAYQLLANRRADVLLQFDDILEPWKKEHPDKVLYQNHFDILPCHLMISKKTPDAAEILKRLEKALKKIDQHRSEN